MAYNFIKLSETELVKSTENTPNILIEDSGDIKRISADDITTPQVNADWNETDSNSAAFILNKPEIPDGGANVITYVENSGLTLDGAKVTGQEIVDAWNNGSIIRVDIFGSNSLVLGMSYWENSGVIEGQMYYLNDSGTITPRSF